MHHRYILVPKTPQAVHDYNFGEWNEEDLYLWELTNEQFDMLWNEGVFDFINDLFSSLIDDYEDEDIYYQNLKCRKDELISEIEKFACKNEINKLIELIQHAIESETLISFAL